MPEVVQPDDRQLLLPQRLAGLDDVREEPAGETARGDVGCRPGCRAPGPCRGPGPGPPSREPPDRRAGPPPSRRPGRPPATARSSWLPRSAEGPVSTLVGSCLAPEHRRGHGALYDAVNVGR